MFRSAAVWLLAIFVLGGCIGNAADAIDGDDENYVAAAEVEGLMAPRVAATPPETEAPDAAPEGASTINGKLPERPALTPLVTESVQAKPDAEPWAADSALYEVFKEQVTLNSEAAEGGGQ